MDRFRGELCRIFRAPRPAPAVARREKRGEIYPASRPLPPTVTRSRLDPADSCRPPLQIPRNALALRVPLRSDRPQGVPGWASIPGLCATCGVQNLVWRGDPLRAAPGAARSQHHVLQGRAVRSALEAAGGVRRCREREAARESRCCKREAAGEASGEPRKFRPLSVPTPPLLESLRKTRPLKPCAPLNRSSDTSTST
jgi:hypothetical protein